MVTERTSNIVEWIDAKKTRKWRCIWKRCRMKKWIRKIMTGGKKYKMKIRLGEGLEDKKPRNDLICRKRRRDLRMQIKQKWSRRKRRRNKGI